MTYRNPGRIAGLFGLLFAVVLSCHHPNRPPYPPEAPTGPVMGKIHAAYPCFVSTTDPEGEGVSYEFDWGNGDTSAWSRFLSSGLTCVDTNAWGRDGRYSIRARAKDPPGAVSDWSEPWVLSIGNCPPEIPVIDSVPDTIWPGVTATLLFRAIDPDVDSVTFILDFGSGDTVVTDSLVPSNQFFRFQRTWLNTGSFTFRVRARDSRGLLSDWSELHSVLVPGPDLRWRFPAGNRISSSPAIARDGTVLFGAQGRTFFALNPDGTPKWLYPVNSQVNVAPTIDDSGSIYFLADDHYFYSLDSAGILRWRKPVQLGSSSSTDRVASLGRDSLIYSQARYLRAFDAQGNQVWQRSSGGAAAVGADGTLYYESSGSFLAVRPDGSLYWSSSNFYASRSSPPALGTDGTIYWLGTNGELDAFNPDGSLRWSSPLDGDNPRTSPVIAPDASIYCGTENGLYAVGPDGTVKWHFATARPVRSTAAIAADGTIVFGCDDGLLYALDPNGGLRWARGTGGHVRTSPAVAPDGTIYFGSDDGYLYALAGAFPLADSPWPMFHHDAQHTGRAQ